MTRILASVVSLIGERVTPETADAWIAAWEAKAADDGLERGVSVLAGGLGLDRAGARASRSTLERPGSRPATAAA